jgi:hypothetical protein
VAPEIVTESAAPLAVGAVAKATATSTTVSEVIEATEPKVAAVTLSTAAPSPSADV